MGSRRSMRIGRVVGFVVLLSCAAPACASERNVGDAAGPTTSARAPGPSQSTTALGLCGRFVAAKRAADRVIISATPRSYLTAVTRARMAILDALQPVPEPLMEAVGKMGAEPRAVVDGRFPTPDESDAFGEGRRVLTEYLNLNCSLGLSPNNI